MTTKLLSVSLALFSSLHSAFADDGHSNERTIEFISVMRIPVVDCEDCVVQEIIDLLNIQVAQVSFAGNRSSPSIALNVSESTENKRVTIKQKDQPVIRLLGILADKAHLKIVIDRGKITLINRKCIRVRIETRIFSRKRTVMIIDNHRVPIGQRAW